MASTEQFYRNLVAAETFSQAADLQYYVQVPNDWTVLIGDIRGSTDAIEAGQYKAVNMVGAAVIISVINACPDLDLPFVFGGDGGTVLVPPSGLDAARKALSRLRAHASQMFGLELRVGAIPLAALRVGGHDLRVMKLRLSENNHLAMFSGSAIGYADDWLKRASPDDAILIKPPADPDPPDLAGLSCRWQPLRSQRGMIVTLIAAATKRTPAGERQHFLSVTAALARILRSPLELSAPVSEGALQFSFPPAGIDLETAATKGRKSAWRRRLEIRAQALLQLWAERFKSRIGYYDAPKYREEMRHNTDFEKYDGMLRLVLDVTVEQAAEIDVHLHREHAAGRLNYGTHISSEALMTCVVFSLEESRHIHFIDGAAGGFALAAANLKRQLAGPSPAPHDRVHSPQ